MELRPPEECFHLATSATRLPNSTSYNLENYTNQNLYNPTVVLVGFSNNYGNTIIKIVFVPMSGLEPLIPFCSL
jgi:hypothetical protein